MRAFGAVLSGHGVTRLQNRPPPWHLVCPIHPLCPPHPHCHPTAISWGRSSHSANGSEGTKPPRRPDPISCNLLRAHQQRPPGNGGFPGTHSLSAPAELRPPGTDGLLPGQHWWHRWAPGAQRIAGNPTGICRMGKAQQRMGDPTWGVGKTHPANGRSQLGNGQSSAR